MWHGKGFLKIEFDLWIGTSSSRGNTPHESGRTVETGILLQTPKVAEISNINLRCYIFDLQVYITNFTTNHPNEILDIEEENRWFPST